MTCRPNEWMFIAEDKETPQQLHTNSEGVKLSANIYMPKDQNIRRLVFS